MFDIKCLTTTSHLSRTLLPAHFNAIRSLQFAWYFRKPLYPVNEMDVYYPPNDQETWEECWRIIATMKDLRELRVWLGGSSAILTPESELGYLRPLRAIRGLDVFEVQVEWHEMGRSLELRDAPFVLTRVLAPSETVGSEDTP